MKTRDRFLISLPLYGAVLVLVSVIMALSHLIEFNASYMSEERSELKTFYKQIEWALKPYLEKNNLEMVRNYCLDFKENSDIRIKVMNSERKVIADSGKTTDGAHVVSKKKGFLFPNVRSTTYSGEITTGRKKYYVDLIMSEESVLQTLIEAQYNIVIFFVTCFVFLLLCTLYLVLKVQIPFNTLQKSVIKIAKGDFDEEIEVPESRVWREFAMALSTMAQKLKRQIIRLRRLEEYRKEFIANVSHEIKTPLTAISSAVELLEAKEEKFDGADLQCLKILGFQTSRLNNLVNDVLSLSEIEVHQDVDFDENCYFDLSLLLENLIKYLNVTSAEVSLYAHKNVMFKGDKHLIEQAVTNLIVNAVKYSQSDKIDVVLTDETEEVRIDVVDYGIGIEAEHLDRIFERFYRVDKARSRETGGTGLGLAIVKNIAIMHNGYVDVESEVGKGSKFSVILVKNS